MKTRVTAPPKADEPTAADIIRKSERRGAWGPQDTIECRVELGRLLDRKCDETGRPRAAVALEMVDLLVAEARQ
jgi:hypothetical protein